METIDTVNALASLAQETRLLAFRKLVSAGPEGMPAGALANALDVPAPTMSFHLAQLSHAGLIAGRREGRSIRYAVNIEAVRALIGFLVNDCCEGDPALCGLPTPNEACCTGEG